MNPKIPHAIALLALLCTWFSWPVSAQAAACCACTHPQIKGGKFCIQGTADCDGLKNSTNKELANASCSADSSANPCKKTTSGGTCLNEPSDAISFKLSSVPGYSPEAAAGGTPDTLPYQLNVDIPGLTFFAPYRDEREIIIPILAQYIQAFQKVLIGLSLVAAAIMLVYGGWLYIISGTGMKVADGKKIIIDALIGMVITLGAIVILSNINPNTAQLSALRLIAIQPKTFEPVTSAQYGAITGGGKMPTPAEVFDYAKTRAQSANVDPCIVYAIIMAESRGQTLIGHDENQYFGPNASLIQSRLDFLRSRKFASGKSFDAEVPTMPADCNAGNRVECQKALAYPMDYTKNGNGQFKNDDNFNGSAPPDYGLDWRFSHGIGVSMGTIFPSGAKCPDGSRGYHPTNDKCFSVAQLITKEGALDSILAHPNLKPGADPETVFCGYGGRSVANCGPIQNLVKNKMDFYNSCPYK